MEQRAATTGMSPAGKPPRNTVSGNFMTDRTRIAASRCGFCLPLRCHATDAPFQRAAERDKRPDVGSGRTRLLYIFVQRKKSFPDAPGEAVSTSKNNQENIATSSRQAGNPREKTIIKILRKCFASVSKTDTCFQISISMSTLPAGYNREGNVGAKNILRNKTRDK